MGSKVISDSQKLLNVQQAAALLGVNPGTIRRWAQTNTLKGLKVGIRGDWRFTEASIRQLTTANDRQTIQPHPSPVQPIDATTPVTSGLPPQKHTVQFYEDEAYLLQSLTLGVQKALEEGAVCVMIAMTDRLQKLEHRLTAAGVDINAVRNNRFIPLDAQTVLDRFMVQGQPDKTRFLTVVGSVIAAAAHTGAPVWAYGEMVTLLWEQGNAAAVDQLETLWNELAETYDFSLHCSYPLQSFGQDGHTAHFAHISAQHTHVIPAESMAGLRDPEQRARDIALLQQKALSLDRLTALNEAKDEFISLASHQLRTPATGVKQYLGMVLEGYLGELPERQRKALEKAYESNERQIKIINDLLLLVRVDAGQLNLTKEACDVVQLVRDVMAEQESEITRRQQSITLQAQSEVLVPVDVRYMRMVLENLIANASKYSPENRPITVRVHSAPNGVDIQVADKGIGMSETDQQKLYRKFSRIHNKQTMAVEGTGIGLYWSKKIIEFHGGQLSVVSAPNKGSTFTISLPLSLGISLSQPIT